MPEKESRRKHKRYPVHWKTSVIFDESKDRPVLHTETEDLSIAGAAMHSDYEDLTGSFVTLLLARQSLSRQPPALEGLG